MCGKLDPYVLYNFVIRLLYKFFKFLMNLGVLFLALVLHHLSGVLAEPLAGAGPPGLHLQEEQQR